MILKNKPLFLFMAIVTGLIFYFSYYVTTMSIKSYSDKTFEQSEIEILNIESMIDAQLKKSEVALSKTTSKTDLQYYFHHPKNNLSKEVSKKLMGDSSTERLFVFTDHLHNSISSIGIDLSISVYWPKALLRDFSKKNKIVDINLIKINGVYYFSYTSSVFDNMSDKNVFLGYVIMLEEISLLTNITKNKINNSFLFYTNDKLISSSKSQVITSDNEQYLFNILNKKNDKNTIFIFNENHLVIHKQTKNGFGIVHLVDERKFKDVEISFTIIGFISSFLLTYFLNIRIIRLYYFAIKLNEKIENKDKDKTQDEMGKLSTSFLKMKNSLETSHHKINKLAYFDDLTGLANRRSLNSYLDDAIDFSLLNKLQMAVIMIDVDEFKDINDAYGHQFGDGVLIEISERLEKVSKSTLSKSGCLYKVCRIAGDEFAIIIQNIEEKYILNNLAENIVAKLSNTYSFDLEDAEAAVSLGLSIFPQNGTNKTSLLKNADMAMYHAKNKGKNRFEFFDERMNKKAQKKLEMRNKILKALSENEFMLYFQPKVESNSKKINEFEALIRWNHPDDGMISPAIFIPFAEENGLINKIGDWVVEKLCGNIKDLEDSGWVDFRISFNTSPQQLQDNEFIANIKDCINAYGINPNHLEMEITEHSLAKDLDTTVECLRKVKKMGISIALDDFGTGYSSLSYLEKMPIDTIKIDRSFVSQAKNNDAKTAIISTIITLAKGLGMKTVAEGVETKDDLDIVVEKGCDFIQGFYYYPPLPISDIIKITGHQNIKLAS